MTIAWEIIWKFSDTIMTKVDEMVKAIETLGSSICLTMIDINQSIEMFMDRDFNLCSSVIAWVQWFNTSWTAIFRRYNINPVLVLE